MDSRFLADYIKFKKSTLRWMDRINAKPSYPWLNTVTGSFLAIPGLRGLWPMSSVGDSVGGVNSDVTDVSGQGRHLTNNGQAQLYYTGIVPTYYFDALANDYLSRPDEAGLDILGTESYISTSLRGLTLGGWYQFSALSPASSKGIIGKWVSSVANQRAYLIYIGAGTSVARFVVSNLGTAADAAVNSTFTLSVDTWYFIVARYDPSSEVSITVNGTQNEDTSAATVPANLFNSSADFNIMAYESGGAATRNNGYASYNFLSCMYLSDNIINHLYEMSRGMFGV